MRYNFFNREEDDFHSTYKRNIDLTHKRVCINETNKKQQVWSTYLSKTESDC